MKEIAINRKVHHDYIIEETYEAGISLVGTELKSLRKGKASIKEAYVSFNHAEAFIKDMHISIYDEGSYNNHDETRERKLLLHKSQIVKLASKCKVQGYTVIPLKVYFNDQGRVKVEIGLAKGKTLYDKRESDKKKTMEMAIKQALKR